MAPDPRDVRARLGAPTWCPRCETRAAYERPTLAPGRRWERCDRCGYARELDDRAGTTSPPRQERP